MFVFQNGGVYIVKYVCTVHMPLFSPLGISISMHIKYLPFSLIRIKDG